MLMAQRRCWSAALLKNARGPDAVLQFLENGPSE
jgi:hypothetical protein